MNESCPVEGCDRTISYNGMCKRHATRVARHGDPLAFTPHRERRLPRGAANPNWTGDNVTYNGMHLRVRHAKGRASGHLCAECGHPAAQWSYDHADPQERMSDEGAYSLSIDHYVPRCVPCHKAIDLSLKSPGMTRRIDLEAVGQLRAEGLGVRLIAKLLGVTERRIREALAELGLPRARPENWGRRGNAASQAARGAK